MKGDHHPPETWAPQRKAAPAEGLPGRTTDIIIKLLALVFIREEIQNKVAQQSHILRYVRNVFDQTHISYWYARVYVHQSSTLYVGDKASRKETSS